MEWYFWVIIIVSILLIISIIGGLFVALKVAKPPRRSLLDTSILEEELNPGIMDFYKKSLTREYKIKTKDGLLLQAYFFKNNEETDKYIVMPHGHTYTHHGMLKYAKMMMQYGYNIVLYDQRYHGDSEGKFTSLGYKEKDDLYQVITDTFNKYGSHIYLGTYGESMGSSTVLSEVKFDDRVKFIFSDCGFTELSDLVGEFFKKIKYLPKWPIFYISSLFFRIITGSYYSGISPFKAIKDITIPIFFAHGEADQYINYNHTLKMYEFYKGPKQLFIGKNESFHAGSYCKDKENYEKSVKEFVNKYLVK